MILKLISLFVVVLAVRLMLDKIGAYFPDKCQMYITYLMLFLSDFLIKIAMLFLVELILTTSSDFSIYDYWVKIPYHAVIPYVYLAYQFHKVYKKAKHRDNELFIENTSCRASYPSVQLNYFLIKSQTISIILEEKLTLLKSFSPIPVALLMLNNFTDLSLKNFDIEANTINIVLIIILGIYAYFLISTFSKWRKNLWRINLIKEELYKIENPNLFEKFIKQPYGVKRLYEVKH